MFCTKAAAVMVYTKGRRNFLVIPLCVRCHRILSEYSNLIMPLLIMGTSYTNARYCLFEQKEVFLKEALKMKEAFVAVTLHSTDRQKVCC